MPNQQPNLKLLLKEAEEMLDKEFPWVSSEADYFVDYRNTIKHLFSSLLKRAYKLGVKDESCWWSARDLKISKRVDKIVEQEKRYRKLLEEGKDGK